MRNWITINNFVALFTIPLIRIPMYFTYRLCEGAIYYFDRWDRYIPALQHKDW